MDGYHESKRVTPTDGHEGPIWEPLDVHDHGSTRAERVSSNVFWGESKSGRAHYLVLGPDDGDDILGTHRADPLNGRTVADWGGGVASVFLQAEDDANSRLNWKV